MKNALCLFTLQLILTLASRTYAQQANSIAEKADEYLTAVTRLHRFNGTVLIAQRGTVLLQKGYGWRNESAKTSNDTNSIFQLGSITKTFVGAPLQMQILGQTQDDAVGEAFDKSAKLLGLPYPGGPHLDRLAKQGNPLAFRFPLTEMPGLDFSFSGIKTAILYFLRDQTRANPDFVAQNLPDLCASIQHTLILMLLTKLKRATRETDIRDVAIAGGVSANSGLRAALTQLGDEQGWRVFIPKLEYCTDNAGMIARAAAFKFEAGEFVGQDVSPLPRLAF